MIILFQIVGAAISLGLIVLGLRYIQNNVTITENKKEKNEE